MRDTNSNNPDDASYWPIRLPPRQLTERVKEMLAAGHTWQQIEYATGVTFNRIGYIKSHPDLWDTVDDEVAVERALQGDASVLPTLTLYERDTVRTRLRERLEADPWESGYGNEFVHWLSELGFQWGVDVSRLRARINRQIVRRRAA